MIKKTSIFTTSLSALVVACAIAVISAPPAAAQTATNLKCSGCIKSKQIKNGKVKGKDLKDSTVTGSKIAPNAVDGSKISDGAVGSSEVAGESLTAIDLGDEAGANFAENISSVSVNSTDQIVTTLTLVAPAPGVVIVNVSGHYFFNNGGPVQGQCTITQGTTVDSTNGITGEGTNVSPDDIENFAGTRGFEVAAGSNDFNLVCQSSSAAITVLVVPRLMTAIYVPTRY